MDKFASMQTFIAVADHGGFTAAADALRLSKAMVSKQIQGLEQTLGTRLLSRSTRRFQLTDAGSAYLAGWRAVLVEVATLERRVMDFGDTPRGLLKVLAPTSFGSFQLTPALADYAERYPEVRVQLTLSDHPHGLLEEGVDLALQIGPLADSSLIARRIANVQLLVCGAPSYFARHPAPEALTDLTDHNCLRYSQGARKGNWLFKSDGRDVQIKVSGDFEASTGDAVRMAALRGHGLAQLPSHMLREDWAAGRLVGILEAFTPAPTPLHAIYAHRELSATVRLFIAYLEHHFHAQDARLHEL